VFQIFNDGWWGIIEFDTALFAHKGESIGYPSSSSRYCATRPAMRNGAVLISGNGLHSKQMNGGAIVKASIPACHFRNSDRSCLHSVAVDDLNDLDS